jgi:hypothetical protein
MLGIKLAAEIKAPADAYVHLRDMSVPEDTFVEWQMRGALLLAIYSLSRGRPVYAGCMGGYGRTGTFLALLAKCFGESDPVGYVRAFYHGRAVETPEQEAYVDEFNPYVLRVALAGARAYGGWSQRLEHPVLADSYGG